MIHFLKLNKTLRPIFFEKVYARYIVSLYYAFPYFLNTLLKNVPQFILTLTFIEIHSKATGFTYKFITI